MWPPPSRQLNYGEMGMFVVAPASSFHHHHHHHNETINLPDHHSIATASNAAATTLGVGVGVIPLLSSAPCLEEDMLNGINRGRSSNIQFWQHQQNPHHQNYMKKSIDQGFTVGGGSGGTVGLVSGGTVGLSSTSASSTMTCQDCGNQAKKDCSHRRCRTCCKSRGFDCATHVKSTWVPAARRRERQLMTTSTGGVTPTAAAAGSSASTSGAKKPRLTSQTTTTSHTSTSNTTPPRSFDTSSSHQDVSFKEALPPQVRAPAVFKCVRVTAVDDGDDEYAYQAVVKIGGHVFKGFLYDQGLVESRDAFPNLSELHLGGGIGSSTSGGGGGGGGRNMASSSSPMLDPSDVYAASGGGLLGGSTYGN